MITRITLAVLSAVIAVYVLITSHWILPGWLCATVLLGLGAFALWNGFVRAVDDETGDPLQEVRPSPLIGRTSPLSIWDGIAIGFTSSGRELRFSPTDTSLLIAGEPRAGKTVCLNNILAAAALDPRCRFAVFDGKGSNEFSVWSGVADKVDRTAEAAALLTYLNTLMQEVRRRYDSLAEMRAVKLTREIYMTSMPIYLVIVDELAAFTMTYPNKKTGQAIVQLMAKIAAQGPAVGVVLIEATQQTGVNVVPGILRDNVSMRIGFRLPRRAASDMILGTGMAKQGFDASTIRRGAERGVGFADVDGNSPRRFRTYRIEFVETSVVAQIARLVRAGVVTQELPSLPADASMADRDLVADIKAIWQGGEEKLHNAVILERLQHLDAAYYGPWSAQLLGRRMRDVGLAKYKVQFTQGDRIKGYGLPRGALDAVLVPDDGSTADDRRQDREDAAYAALDESGRMAYEARLAEIERAIACTYCRCPLDPVDNPATVDHLVPLIKGGGNDPWNLVPACRSCNSSKKDKDVYEWLASKSAA